MLKAVFPCKGSALELLKDVDSLSISIFNFSLLLERCLLRLEKKTILRYIKFRVVVCNNITGCKQQQSLV